MTAHRSDYPTAKELVEKLGGRWNDRMRRGNGCCPAHDDANPSLDIVEKDGKLLFICRAGCSQDAVIAALRAQGFWPERREKLNGHAAGPKRIVAAYDYVDAEGTLRFQAVRYDPKGFRQRRPDDRGGWIWNLPLDRAHRFLPFRLPEVIEAIGKESTVFVLEGEKDVLTAARMGIPATCNAGGAGKWTIEHAAYLKGADVVLVADKDPAGQRHMEDVAASLVGVANRMRQLTLPGLPNKGDLTDWVHAGGTAEQLWALVEKAPEIKGRPNRAERRAASSAIRSIKASEVKSERITWVWPCRIAKGKHTALAGEPGVGKSTLLYWLSAVVSKGGAWPAGEGSAPTGSVILLSAEDGVADTIVPRFLAAGGDPEKLHILQAVQLEEGGERTFNLQADLAALEEKIIEVGDVTLVIIDPISSYLGDVDSHKNAAVRNQVDPLNAMADRLGVAIVSNSHFAKSGSANNSRALHRIIGSIAFVASPRVALCVVDDGEVDEEGNPKNPGRKLLLHVKTNIGPAPLGLAYRLEQVLATYIGEPPEPLYASTVQWEAEHVTVTADRAIAEHEGSLKGNKLARPSPARDAAEAFIRELFKGRENETLTSKQINDAAREAGITAKPLQQARERLTEAVTDRADDGVVKGWLVQLKKGVQP